MRCHTPIRRADFAVGRYNLETSSVLEGVFLPSGRANGSNTDGGQSPRSGSPGCSAGAAGHTAPADRDGWNQARRSCDRHPPFPGEPSSDPTRAAAECDRQSCPQRVRHPDPNPVRKRRLAYHPTWRAGSGKPIKPANEPRSAYDRSARPSPRSPLRGIGAGHMTPSPPTCPSRPITGDDRDKPSDGHRLAARLTNRENSHGGSAKP